MAIGRTDAYFMTSVNAWDVAAGVLLVSEAGWVVTDFEDKEFTTKSKTLLASNSETYTGLYKDIKKILKK